MENRLFNWSYRAVTDFLKDHNFTFFEQLSRSRESWIRLTDKGEPDRIVEVNFTHDNYSTRALKTMIRQSGIPKAEWIEWGNS